MIENNYKDLGSINGNKNNPNEEKSPIKTPTKNLTELLSRISFMKEATTEEKTKILTDLFSGEIQKQLEEINSQISENVQNKSEKTDLQTTPDLSKKTEEESPTKDSPIENLTKLLEVNFMEGMNVEEKANVISALHSKVIQEQLGEIISKLTSNQKNSDTKTDSSINVKNQNKSRAI